MMISPMLRALLLGATLAPLVAVAHPEPYPHTIPVAVPEEQQPLAVGGFKLSFGGRFKLDAMYTRVSDADLPTPSFIRDQ